MNKNELEERLIQFAVAIVRIVERMPNTKSGNHLGGQLLRSGTSPALNYGSAEWRIEAGFHSQDKNSFKGVERDICMLEDYAKSGFVCQ